MCDKGIKKCKSLLLALAKKFQLLSCNKLFFLGWQQWWFMIFFLIRHCTIICCIGMLPPTQQHSYTNKTVAYNVSFRAFLCNPTVAAQPIEYFLGKYGNNNTKKWMRRNPQHFALILFTRVEASNKCCWLSGLGLSSIQVH